MNRLLHVIIERLRIRPVGVAMPGPRFLLRIRNIVQDRSAKQISRGRVAGLVGACAAICATFLTVTITRARSEALNQFVATPHFRVESIKLCGKGMDVSTYSAFAGPHASPGRLFVPCASVMTMIRAVYLGYPDSPYSSYSPAWSVPIQNAPSWLQSEGYAIVAEVEGSPSAEVMKGPVLQAILEDRFRLRIHRETRDVAAYALAVAPDGPKLCAAAGGEGSPDFPPDSPCFRQWWAKSDPADFQFRAQNVTTEELCERLSEYIDDAHRFVVNETGLTGRFDIHVVFAPSDEASRVRFAKLHGWSVPEPTAPTLASAIEQQLGLRLKPIAAPGDFLVIDHIEEPTAN